jgi:hypothetical protein
MAQAFASGQVHKIESTLTALSRDARSHQSA